MQFYSEGWQMLPLYYVIHFNVSVVLHYSYSFINKNNCLLDRDEQMAQIKTPVRLQWLHLQSVPLSSYFCSRDFGWNPEGTNEVRNLKHSNKEGVLRLWRTLWLYNTCWELLLGERVTAVPCSGKRITLLHRSETDIIGAHVHCRATGLPDTGLTQCHHPHQTNWHDPPVTQSCPMIV